jgi:membrane protease YdiL (CAAX protease family)
MGLLSRTIEAPRREHAFGSALILAAAVGLGTLVLLPPGRSPWLVGACAAIAVVGLLARAEQAFHLGLFLAFVVAAMRLPLGPWPLPPAVGIVIYLAAVLPLRAFRGGVGWARVGRLDRNVLLLVLGSAAVAAGALVVWFEVVHPDVSDLLRELPQVPAWQLVLLALVFSMANAAVEETIFRGLLLHALDAALGVGWAPVVLQAAAFGMLHLHGFPRGWLGVGLATIYGLMMGVLRRRSGGMLAPWLGHVAVDAAIVGIMVGLG